MEFLKSLFVNGGWIILVYILFRIVLWIIRQTETKKDDEIVDNYVIKAVKLALQVIPKPEETQINWLKFTANVLAEFNRAYTKEQGETPDSSTFEKAKTLIKEIADNAQFANAKEMIEEYIGKDENK